MDKIDKALKKLSDSEQKKLKGILQKLVTGKTDRFDIKKLKGRNDIFRLRKGDIRIIYQKKKNNIYILKLSKRNEKTYKL